MANETTDKSLEETLNKTDFGQVINENKKSILTIGVFLVIAIIAFSFYQSTSKKQYNLNLSNAYDVKTSLFDKFLSKELKVEEFLPKLKALPNNLVGEPSLLPAFLSSTKELVQQGKLSEAQEALAAWQTSFSKNSVGYYFITFSLANVKRDLGQTDEAISSYEALKSSPVKVAKADVLFNLVDLYIKSGQEALAQDNLKLLQADYADSEQTKLANLLVPTKS